MPGHVRIHEALRQIQRCYDHMLACELERLEDELIRDGLGGATIDLMLERHREDCEEFCRGALEQAERWLRGRQLH